MEANPSYLNFFDAATIDRMAEMRKDKDWLQTQRQHPGTRVVPVWREKHLVRIDGQNKDDALVAVFPTYSEFRQFYPAITPEIFLGIDRQRDTHYFAVELPEEEKNVAEIFSSLGEFQTLRFVGALVDRHQGALMAYARGMTIWHRNHRFCARCGAATRCAEGGHLRICSDKTCERHHFPRTDPAVIVLISDEENEHCLLGRAPRWPDNVYSTLAGFVEPGESLEMAVVREVGEETGVCVDPARVVYHSSQPWPFPASIMLGFTAHTAFQEIRFDPSELEDARWFSRADIDNALKQGTLRLPTPYSIANRLITDWRNLKLTE